MTWLWFLYATLPPAFWSLSNIFDQYVTRHYCANSPVTFIAIAGIASIPVSLLLLPWIIQSSAIFDPTVIGFSVLSALCFSLALFPYFYALEAEDAHTVSPLIQSNIFMVAILAWVFLGESLTLMQIVGGILMITAAIASTKPTHIASWPRRAIIMILLAALCWAFFNFFLRMINPTVPTLVITFWICMTWVGVSIAICTHTPTRTKVLNVFFLDRGRAFTLNFIQQVGDIGATIARSAALAYPIIPAAVTVVIGGGVQPFFAVLFGSIAAMLFPNIYTFNLTRRAVLYKLGCFVVMMIGLWMVIMPSGSGG